MNAFAEIGNRLLRALNHKFPSYIKVLVIDDDALFVRAVERMLETPPARVRFQIDWSPTYEDALIQMHQNDHDCYIVDVHLRGEANGYLSGFDLITEAGVQGCFGPFVVMTGNPSDEIEEKALELNIMDFIRKDEVSTGVLCRSVRYAVKNYRLAIEARDLIRTK